MSVQVWIRSKTCFPLFSSACQRCTYKSLPAGAVYSSQSITGELKQRSKSCCVPVQALCASFQSQQNSSCVCVGVGSTFIKHARFHLHTTVNPCTLLLGVLSRGFNRTNRPDAARFSSPSLLQLPCTPHLLPRHPPLPLKVARSSYATNTRLAARSAVVRLETSTRGECWRQTNRSLLSSSRETQGNMRAAFRIASLLHACIQVTISSSLTLLFVRLRSLLQCALHRCET